MKMDFSQNVFKFIYLIYLRPLMELSDWTECTPHTLCMSTDILQ